MDAADYEPCAARLSQGDIVRAPIAIFARGSDITAPPRAMGPFASDLPLHDPVGLTFPLPGLRVGVEQAYLRAWYQLAVVISPDCGIDKPNLPVLVAPLFPTASVPRNELDGLRADTRLNAFLLPAAQELEFSDGSRSAWPEFLVDLARATATTQGLIADERLISLGESLIERLQERLVRYFALKEMSSTGSIDALPGRMISDVRVIESSKKRHTVLLTLDDGGLLVLYQEPRRKGPQLESIRIRQGRFSRNRLQAPVSTDLIVRFENDDTRQHRIACPEAGLSLTPLPPSRTTDVLVRCPAEPADLRLVDLDSAGHRIAIEVRVLPDPSA